jgi:hypothetical protein
MSATSGHLVRNMYMRCRYIYSEQGRHNKAPGGVSPIETSKAADNWALPFTCVGSPGESGNGQGTGRASCGYKAGRGRVAAGAGEKGKRGRERGRQEAKARREREGAKEWP